MTFELVRAPRNRQIKIGILALATSFVAACGSTTSGRSTGTESSSDTSSEALSTAATSSMGASSVTTTATSTAPTSTATSTSSSSGGATSNTTTTDFSDESSANTTSASASSSNTSTSVEEESSSTAGDDSGTFATLSSDSGSGETSEPSGDFQPCPTNGDPCIILPFGDSITVGLGYDGGYRVKLFELAVNDNKNITFVGHSTQQDAGGPNGPEMVAGKMFPRDHEGHSGWTIAGGNGIAGRVPSPAFDDNPHIVLLHIGTNDMYAMANGEVSGPQFASKRLGALVDQITETAPDALVVVATIVPLPFQNGTYEDEVDAYNAGVVTEVNARIDAGKHVLFVDQFEGFPETELGDQIHPNKAGYDRMGTKWYEAIKSYLPDAE